MGAEIPDIGIEKDQELGIGLVQRHRHGLALSSPDGPGRHDPRPCPAGHRGGVVDRPVVHHHDVFDEVGPSPGPGQRSSYAGDDSAHRGGLVARRQAHGDPTAGARRHQGRDHEVPVVEAAHGGATGRTRSRNHTPIIPHRGAPLVHEAPPLTGVVGFVHHGGIIQSG